MPDTSTGRPRHPSVLGGALLGLLVALLLAASLGSGASASGAGSTTIGGAKAGGATMKLIDQSGVSAADGNFAAIFEIAGVPAQSYLVVNLYPRIKNRVQLDDAVSGKPHNSSVTFDPVVLPGDPAATPVSTGFAIDLTGTDDPRGPCCWSRRLTDPGVYPVKVELREPGGKAVRSIVTFLLRAPEPHQTLDATHVAVLASLRTENVTNSAGDPLSAAETNGIDQLAAALVEHSNVPASFSLTPESVARLAHTPASAESLAGLRQALEGQHREVLGAPYVDIDPSTLVRSNLADEIVRQADLGNRTLRDQLKAPAVQTWALQRSLNASTVDVLDRMGVSQLLLDDRAVVDGVGEGPVRLAGATDRSRALVLHRVDEIGSDGNDSILMARRLVGRLAALGSIERQSARVLQIDIASSGASEVGAVLDALDSSGAFLRVDTVTGLFARTPTAPSRVDLTRPAPADLGSYPNHLRRSHELLTSYASMVPSNPELVEAFAEPLARTAAANLPADTRIDQVIKIEGELTAQFQAITIPASDRVTLGARDGEFPLAIRSTRSGPTEVIIELEASDRLMFPSNQIRATLTKGRTLVPIRVRTRTTGDTPLRITVRSADGKIVLTEGRYSIRSTAVSGVGLLLTIGAAAFLALWWGRHWVRHRRRARHARSRFGRRHDADPEHEPESEPAATGTPSKPIM